MKHPEAEQSNLTSEPDLNHQRQIPCLRRIKEDGFHGYVEDPTGIGKTKPEFRIKPLELPRIECGLGSSVTGAPEGVHNPGIDYPEPFYTKLNVKLLEELGLENLDPDQVIWRTSNTKLIDELLRVLTNRSARIIIRESDFSEEIALVKKRINHPWDIVQAINPEETKHLQLYLEQTGPSVVYINGQNVTTHEIETLKAVAEQKGHYLLIHDSTSQHTKTFASSQFLGIIGESYGLSYAILSASAFLSYKPHRMVFMVPQHATEADKNRSPHGSERELSEQVLARFSLHGKKPEEVLWAEGSYDVLDQLVAMLPHQQIIGLGPHFPYLEQHTLRNHKRYTKFDQRSGLFLEGNLAHFTDFVRGLTTIPSILYVDTPSNPSGYVYSYEQIRALAETAREKGHSLIVDCAYGDLVEDIISYYALSEEFENGVVVGSLSKNLGLAADRLGFGVMGNQVAETVNPFRLPSTITKRAYQKASAALEPDALTAHIEYSGKRVRDGKRFLIEKLHEVSSSVNNGEITIQIASTNAAVSILYVRVEGMKIYLDHLRAKDPNLSLGRVLQERWGVTCEPGEEFANTHRSMGIDGFRLRIPSNIDVSEEIAVRIKGMIEEVVHNPSSILENNHI